MTKLEKLEWLHSELQEILNGADQGYLEHIDSDSILMMLAVVETIREDYIND